MKSNCINSCRAVIVCPFKLLCNCIRMFQYLYEPNLLYSSLLLGGYTIYYSLCIFFFLFFSIPTGQSRRRPSGVWACSMFLLNGEVLFLWPLLLHVWSGGGFSLIVQNASRRLVIERFIRKMWLIFFLNHIFVYIFICMSFKKTI